MSDKYRIDILFVKNRVDILLIKIESICFTARVAKYQIDFLHIKYIHNFETNGAPYCTSIDVLPSKNQELCEFCTHVNQLKHCRYFN